MKRRWMMAVLPLLLGGCATSNLGWKSQPGGEKAPGKPQYVEDFDPKTLNNDDLVISPIDAAEQAPATDAATHGVEAGTPEAQVEEVMGYRVQIMLGKDEAAIQEEKRKAMFKFEVPVYVVFESPNYKIRVGDCLTRHEADQLRDLAARRYGYDGAWVVRSKVKRQRSRTTE